MVLSLLLLLLTAFTWRYFLRSRADSLRSHVILPEWIAFYRAFFNIHRSGVLTALAWLVARETAAFSARSVYTIQPWTMSLHTKPHTQGASIFVFLLCPDKTYAAGWRYTAHCDLSGWTQSLQSSLWLLWLDTVVTELTATSLVGHSRYRAHCDLSGWTQSLQSSLRPQ